MKINVFSHAKWAALAAGLTMFSAVAYGQRSLGKDDVFVFDSYFSKGDYSKKYSTRAGTGDEFWRRWLHELMFYEGAGYSAIAEFGKGGFGNNVGLAYILHFSPPEWGALVGAELGIYNAKYSNLNKPFAYAIDRVDIPSLNIHDDIMYHVDMLGINEKTMLFYVNVPVMVRYLFAVSEFGQSSGKGGYTFGSPDVQTFYVQAGAKIGIPVYSSFSTTYSKADVFMNNLGTGQKHNNQPQYGLQVYEKGSNKGDVAAALSVMFSVEFGYVLPLQKITYSRPWHEKVNFYAGIYFDYAFNRIAVMQPSPLMYDMYGDPSTPLTSSVLATNPLHNATIGLKIGASFTWGPYY